jgi:hypothetical protein
MSTINFYFIDNSKWDFVMWFDSVVTANDIGIKNVADMVRKILAKCSSGDKIGELRIFGHGNRDGQWIGGDWVTSASVSSHTIDFARLRPLFDPFGMITLGGCQVGLNDLLLAKLSAIVGVPVRAFTAKQRPGVPGDEGAETKCYYLSCTHGKPVGFDHMDNE